ncbi:MAG: hypothetical protein ACI8TQ_000144 [Planctomycetota bacterium]|jgi:hypothetical protein
MVANSIPPLRPLLGFLACLMLAWTVNLACEQANEPISLVPEPAEIVLDESAYPETAVLGTYKNLLEDQALERHPSDGGGRAWLESGPKEVVTSTRHTWTVAFETGPLGIAEGGMIYFMTSPFWGWDDHPQTSSPQAPGYMVVSTEAEGVELESIPFGGNLFGVQIAGRALASGEVVHFEYGAGEVGARSDKYAERNASFWISVDGDGDGVRKLIEETASIDVIAGDPSGLWLTLPTTVEVGTSANLTLALLDRSGNAWIKWEGDVVFDDLPEGIELPERITLKANDEGHATIQVVIEQPGLVRLRARLDPPLLGAPEDYYYESNPMLASENSSKVLWADLHGHSQLSDGTGTPEDFYRYARDIAALDIAVLTDHDHWGIHFLDSRPDLWDHIKSVANQFNEPGRFVSLLGYEWTSWLYGHRHVVYFTEDGELFSSMDPETEDPDQLWAALKGKDALTFAHHSAGGPIGTDWSFIPDPEIEPVTEIVSVHGSSEAPDSPQRIYRSISGNFVRDILDRGHRFGFIGSGDSHDGHPGLAHLGSPSGGLAAILAEDHSRASVLEALRARRVYATNGSRILLRASLSGARMGATIAADKERPLELRVHAIGTGPIEAIDIIRSGDVFTIECDGKSEVQMPPLEMDLKAGEYLYVRVRQEDGGIAWSSPFYAD